jgi:hypothetical protein
MVRPETHDVDRKWGWLLGLHFKNAWRTHLAADTKHIPQQIKEAVERCDRRSGLRDWWKKAWGHNRR